MRRARTLGLAAALWAIAKVASAGDSEIEIANARQLAIQGIDAVEGGNCKTGEPLLERAEKLHHAIVHLQYLARCRSNEGRLVAATEMWRQIIREGAPTSSSPAVQAAVAEANAQLPRTLPRLAATTVRAKADYPNIKVLVDGELVPPELLGAQQVIDPGEHQLEADAPGFAHFSKHWTVAEGQSAEVVIALTPTAGGAGQGSGPPVEGGAPTTEKKGSGLTTAGFIVGAAGVAALVGGTVTLLTWKNKEDSLAQKCTLPGGGCDPKAFGTTDPAAANAALEDERSSIHTLTTLTNVLLFGGGALLAGGVTLIIVGSASKSSEPQTALAIGAPFADFGITVRGRY